MRILIITALYHPSKSPNVYRWSAIAEYWVQQGHEVHVLCTSLLGEPKSRVCQGVQVHRAGQHTLLDWALSVWGNGQVRGRVGGLQPVAHSRARKCLEWLIDRTWRRLYWPDGAILWYGPGKRRVRQLLSAHSFDAMISVGLPFTAHRITVAGKQAFPKVHWLVDIEDPFAISKEFFVNNFQLYRRRNFRAEADILAKADAVSFTVLAAQEAYEQHFSEQCAKFAVTPPLFNLRAPAITSNAPLPYFESNHLHLSYFGSFYQGVRTPDTFLKLLAQSLRQAPALAQRLRVHFFGEINGPFAERFQQFPELNSVVQLHGLISRADVSLAIEQTDVLLNISNTTTYHLPSKSADYLMSRKPIVNIYSAEADTFKAFFEGYPLIMHIRLLGAKEAEQEAVRFIDFLEHAVGKRVDQEVVERLGRPYRLERIAERYMMLLQKTP
ncbi:MAG: hypothetical protein AAF798_08770 [Bacteroidota bacterium]